MSEYEGWNWAQMWQARLALENGVDISHLDPKTWDWYQMLEARWALKAGVDISHLDPELWDWAQMLQERIRLVNENKIKGRIR